MPTTCRVPAAQDGLKVLLDARAGLSGVPISIGWPDGDTPAEFVDIALEIADDRHIFDTTGTQEDRFTIPVRVLVRKSGTTVAARDRAYALAAEVEAAVRSDRRLNNSIFDSEISGMSANEGRDPDEQRLIGITVNVACIAILA